MRLVVYLLPERILKLIEIYDPLLYGIVHRLDLSKIFAVNSRVFAL